MKIFMGFMLACFFVGWALNKLNIKILVLFLVVLSAIVTTGYFFLDWI